MLTSVDACAGYDVVSPCQACLFLFLFHYAEGLVLDTHRTSDLPDLSSS